MYELIILLILISELMTKTTKNTSEFSTVKYYDNSRRTSNRRNRIHDKNTQTNSHVSNQEIHDPVDSENIDENNYSREKITYIDATTDRKQIIKPSILHHNSLVYDNQGKINQQYDNQGNINQQFNPRSRTRKIQTTHHRRISLEKNHGDMMPHSNRLDKNHMKWDRENYPTGSTSNSKGD